MSTIRKAARADLDAVCRIYDRQAFFVRKL